MQLFISFIQWLDFKSDQWLWLVFVLGLRISTDAIIHGAIQNQNPPRIYIFVTPEIVGELQLLQGFFHAPLLLYMPEIVGNSNGTGLIPCSIVASYAWECWWTPTGQDLFHAPLLSHMPEGVGKLQRDRTYSWLFFASRFWFWHSADDGILSRLEL